MTLIGFIEHTYPVILQAIFNGMGTALGSYFAVTHVIGKFDREYLHKLGNRAHKKVKK